MNKTTLTDEQVRNLIHALERARSALWTAAKRADLIGSNEERAEADDAEALVASSLQMLSDVTRK